MYFDVLNMPISCHIVRERNEMFYQRLAVRDKMFKPIFHCNANPLALTLTRLFHIGDTNMLVSKKPKRSLA